MGARSRSWHHVNTVRKRAVRKRRHHLTKRFFLTVAGHPERLKSMRLLVALGSSSIPIDVSRAVEDQLDEEGKASPHDPDKKMEDDYGYTTDSMDGFLTAVSKRLAKAGHDFSYNNAFITEALSSKLHELKQHITDKTS